MRITRRRPATVFFITLGVCLVAVAFALQSAWVILNWRRLVPLLVGIPFFVLLIAGVVLNTIFLVREIRRNERHDSFLNAVTHELKTPIASIKLYLETLQRRTLDEPKRQEFYRIMLEDSERLLATVEQVLKAGEVGQRARNQNYVDVEIAELLRECIQITLQRHHLPPDAILIESEERILSMTVRGNQQDLQTAVLNVLENAVKYSPQGVHISIKLSVESDAWVMISVSDAGVGIPPVHLKRIFKRFYRVPSRNNLMAKGTGLGLFLVRTIARQHGGDASAQSRGEGTGTTVTIQLPRLLTPIVNKQVR